MGERQTPPLASSTPADIQSSGANLAGMKWPPPGWPMFACVTQQSGAASHTSKSRGEDDYLKYEVTATPDGIYQLEILSGSVGRNGTQLNPLIGIRFAAREDWFDDNPQHAVLDIHVRGQRLIPERGAVLRIILAMTFLISRIDRGIAPSIKRVLKMYRLA